VSQLDKGKPVARRGRKATGLSLERQPGYRKEVVLSRVRDVPVADGDKNTDQGTLKWFNPDEGYGYITPDDGGEEVFFTYFATWGGGFRDLQAGDRVSYKIVEGWNGPQAENVSKS
jgi:CspA family cold shock protein